LTLLLAGASFALPDLALLSLVILLTFVLLVNGIESIIAGIRPSSKKQLTLLKLILFALFYGFVNINWIDLFATSAPYYHIWLILTYLAPFGVLLVFQGFKDWQLALSLGLLVSLVNDLGYYFSGDLLFGFHVQLLSWLAGQLGFLGSRVLFVFQRGASDLSGDLDNYGVVHLWKNWSGRCGPVPLVEVPHGAEGLDARSNLIFRSRFIPMNPYYSQNGFR